MKKRFQFIYLLLCLSTVSFSQNDSLRTTNNSVRLDLGYNQGFLKDLNFSALNYKESGLLYSTGYTRQKPDQKNILNIAFDFSLSKLKTEVSDDLTSSIILGNLEISYLRMIMDNKLNFHIGGQYNTYLQILEWDDYESFSFLATHGIGIKGLLSYNPSTKQRYTSSLFLPFFQSLVRPPYNGIDETIIENQDNTVKIILDGKPSSFKKYFAFDWKLNYYYSLSNKFDLSASYTLRYQKVFEINKVIHLQNQLTLGLNYNF